MSHRLRGSLPGSGRGPVWIVGLGLVAALAFVSAALLRRRRTQQRAGRGRSQPTAAGMWQQVDGLTAEEAEARRTPRLEEARHEQARLARRRIWRSSTVSVFNLGLVGLAAVQWLLSDPLSALITVGVLALNIALTAGQQLYATGRIERLLSQARPLVTVIRDGRWRSVEVDDLVVNDVAVVGPGDAFVADGTLLAGGPLAVQPPDAAESLGSAITVAGDPIRAGGYCLQGRGAYQITALPPVTADQTGHSAYDGPDELTPLQRILGRILRGLLALIAIFLAVLLLDIAFQDLVPPVIETVYRDAASVLFSIAPSGLYFMIVVTYAIGSARLGSFGALIRDSRAVESLAQVTTLCLSRTGALTGTDAHLELVPGPDGESVLSETRVRLLIGDLAHTIGGDHQSLGSLKETFGGSRRPAAEVVELDAGFGWGAATFSSPDLKGTLVIGETDVVMPHLSRQDTKVIKEVVAESRSAIGEGASRAAQLLSSRLPKRLTRDRSTETTTEAIADVNGSATSPTMQLAFSSDPLPLFNRSGRRQMPDGFVPLGDLEFTQRVQPEAIEAVSAFRDEGVDVKILSAQDPAVLARTAGQLGLLGPEPDRDLVITGSDLPGMTPAERGRAVSSATVVGHLGPRERALAIQSLRDAGRQVAVVGEGADDLPAMQAAHVSVTLRSASQAALGVADIVLLDDSLLALPKVLRRGQRLVNSLLDILKINLAQVGYVLLMIVAMALGGLPVFFYHPTHGGVIAFITVLIPSFTLTIWASTGALPSQYMRKRLWHFAVPAACTMAVAALTISFVYARTGRGLQTSELAVTYGLVAMGLLLVVFVQPPTRFWVGGDVLSGEWQNTIAALLLFVIYNILVWVPLAQEMLRLAPLTEVWDYAVIGVVVSAWALSLRALWRTPRLRRAMGIVSDRLEGP